MFSYYESDAERRVIKKRKIHQEGVEMMEKVLIDDKESNLEFVKSICGSSDGQVSSTIWLKTKKEPKQEFVSVPKDIQFMMLYPQYKDKHIGLKIGTHILDFEDDWEFSIFNDDEEYGLHWKVVDCVIIPCKREDLKVGDWYCWYLDEDTKRLEELFSYGLYLGNNKCVKVWQSLEYLQVREDTITTNEGNWFKVVPRSEAIK